MKVLLVHSRYQQKGGEDSVLDSERKLLSGRGVDVELFEGNNDSIVGLRGKLEASKSVFSNSDEVARLQAHTARFKPDVVHVHNWFPSLSPAIFRACHERGFPVVHTLHNYRLLCIKASLYRDGRPCEDCLGTSLRLPGVLHSCYRDSLPGSAVATAGMVAHWRMGTWHTQIDRFIALSHFARTKLMEGGLPAEKISIKPNCLDFDPGPQPGDGGYLAFIGRLTDEKGLLTVLRCWRLDPSLPLLRIAGSGPLEAEAREAAASLANVGFLGSQTGDGVAQILSGARALICPSLWYEGMPRVVIESMAAGTPVLASRLGTYLEMIDHGKSGMLFTANDEHALRDCVHEFMATDDPSAMRAATRKQFETLYSAERNLDTLFEIYEQAIASRRAHTSAVVTN